MLGRDRCLNVGKLVLGPLGEGREEAAGRTERVRRPPVVYLDRCDPRVGRRGSQTDTF